MHLGKYRQEAGSTRASVCGGASKAPVNASRLTTRAWLEWRWHQQSKASKRNSGTFQTAVASTLDIPVQQQTCDGPEGDQRWGGVFVFHNRRLVHKHEVLHALQQVPLATSSLHSSLHHKPQQPLQQQQSSQHGDIQPADTGSSSARASNSKLQLMHNIKTATSVCQLKRLYDLARSDMDVIHTASMLNRLAHLCAALHSSHTSISEMPLQQAQAGLPGLPSQLQQSTHEHQHHPNRWHPLHPQQVGLHQCQLTLSQLQQQQQEPLQDAMVSKLQQQQQQHSRALQHQLLRFLLSDFLQRLSSAGPRQISGTLWVIATFRQQAASCSHMQQTVAALLRRLLLPASPADDSDDHCSSSSTGALGTRARLDTSPSTAPTGAADANSVLWPRGTGGWQQQVRRHIRHQLQATEQQQQQKSLLSSGSSTDVANTVWALGRLAGVVDVSQLLPADLLPSSTLDTLEQLCCWHLNTQKPDGTFISSCMVGFGHLGHPVPRLFAALTARAGHNYVKTLRSQQVVALVWACAKLGHHDQQLFNRLLWRAVVVRQALLPQGVSLLLWAAAKVQHPADPRAVSQLLQVWKQADSSQVTEVRGQHIANLVYGLMHLGQLQQQRVWFLRSLLQLAMHKLDDLQPAAIATLLTAVLHVTKGDTAATAAASHRQQMHNATTATWQLATQPVARQHNAADCSISRQQQQAPTAAAGGLLGVLSSGHDSPQVIPWYREVSRRISTQLDDTRPATLFQIIMALAWVGYYDARLYMKLAAAAAAAAATQDRTRQQLSDQSCDDRSFVFSVTQMLQLVWAFARYHHPAPGLWGALLPQLAAAAAADELQLQQLVFLLNASRGSGCERELGALEYLLQLTSKALQQQAALSVPQLVQVAAAASWLSQAQQQLQHGQHVCSSSTGSQYTGVGRHLQRLLPRLVSVVLSQPQVLPVHQLPQLLEVAVTQEQIRDDAGGSSSSPHSAGPQTSVACNSIMATVAGSTGNDDVCQQAPQQRPMHFHHLHAVGLGQLQRLANLAAEQLGHWDPASLVVLLSCHTQEVLYEPVLADAYAEELLIRIEQCSVQTLVSQLHVLAVAAQSNPGYSHSQLVAVAARQLHGKLLQASDAQLQDVVRYLYQLGQQDCPACKAALKMLESCR